MPLAIHDGVLHGIRLCLHRLRANVGVLGRLVRAVDRDLLVDHQRFFGSKPKLM